MVTTLISDQTEDKFSLIAKPDLTFTVQIAVKVTLMDAVMIINLKFNVHYLLSPVYF